MWQTPYRGTYAYHGHTHAGQLSGTSYNNTALQAFIRQTVYQRALMSSTFRYYAPSTVSVVGKGGEPLMGLHYALHTLNDSVREKVPCQMTRRTLALKDARAGLGKPAL